MAGLKHDDDKQRWHSLPLEILEPLADLMEAGRKKYGQFNCLETFENPDERFWDANMRHAIACQLNPLAIDPETGCYHEAARAFSSLMRIYHCKREAIREAAEMGYSVPQLDDGDDWGGGKGQCSLERESQIVAEEVRAFGEQLAAKLNNTVLCHGCGRRWPLGSEHGLSVSATGRCIACRADEERVTYTVPPPQDGDDDPGVVKLEEGGNKKVAGGPEMTPGGGEAIADGCSRGDAWSWKMEYCKTHGLTPADAENWSRAERAFTRGVQRRSDEVIAEIEKQHRDEIDKIEREHLVDVVPGRTLQNYVTARPMYERHQREADMWALTKND